MIMSCSDEGFVVFINLANGEEDINIFVKEFDNEEDAEDFKLSRNKGLTSNKIFQVGWTELTLDDNCDSGDNDKLIVYPKSDINYFHYNTMVDINDVKNKLETLTDKKLGI